MATVTLVTNVYLPKPEGLQALSAALDGEITPAGPGEEVVVLAGGLKISLEVPKFGEDLPVTLDLHGPTEEQVLVASETVMDQLRQKLNWSVSRVGGVK